MFLISGARIIVSPQKPEIMRVDVWTLRCLFNEGRYQERMLAGEFRVTEKSRPAPPLSGFSQGTISKEVYYIDGQTEIARVHQYERADGTLVASRKPDPKSLYEDGVLYRLHKARGPDGRKKQKPHLRFPEGIPRDAYKLWRWIKCKLFRR